MATYTNYRSNSKKAFQSKNMFKIPKQIDGESQISKERRERIIDWCTFYRRNPHLFVQHYFGITLYPYQILWIYWMGLSDSFVSICSRAVGKTWLLALFACVRAVLYPNSKVVVVSSTKAQAGELIEKIADLRNNYPNVAREISNIVTNMNKWGVDFHNGSKILVVASRESSRGKRSTFTIYEEFRLIDKKILDSVIRPFAYVRPAPYLKNPEYSHLAEESKEVFISSAYHKGLWWYDETRRTILAMLKGDNSGFIAIDYAVSLRHQIKTVRQIKNDLSKMDEVTALEEIFNIPWGESADAYFTLKMFKKTRTIKKAFYPQRIPNYVGKKNPYGISKTEGEIRLLACDVAQRAGKTNDLSITSCLRLLPTHKGYFIELVYMESYSGVNSISQSLRIKQLFYDFEADVIVLDTGAGGGGLPMYDQLGQITKDAERGMEYPAMTVLDDGTVDIDVFDELSARTLGINAIPTIFPISATSKLNSIMFVEMRDRLQKKMFGFLVDETTAEDYLLKSSYKKEFLDQDDINSKTWFMMPYVQTSLFINECINLSMSISAGNIKLSENSGGRKDRFSSVLYGTHYVALLDKILLKEEDFDSSREMMGLVQST